MLPVYVINLDRRPDRWAAMKERLNRLGIAFERIPALDAQDLAETLGRDAAAFACPRSHAVALRAFLATDRPAALILEDDVELAEDTGRLLHGTGWWPGYARIVRLESYPATGQEQEALQRKIMLWGVSGRTPSGREVRRLERVLGGSAAYLIDREDAELALGALHNPQRGMDGFLFNIVTSRIARKLRPAQIVPAMAQQTGGKEDSDRAAWHVGNRQPRTTRTPYNVRRFVLRSLGKVRHVPLVYSEAPSGGSLHAYWPE